MPADPFPPWLPLLRKPCDDVFGSKSSWDLEMPDHTALHVERAGQGLNNALYRVQVGGEVYACKLFVIDERQRARREWAALCDLQAAGHRLAPDPVAFAPEGPLPQPALVYHWVEGEPLDEVQPDGEKLRALILGLRQIHDTPPAPGTERLAAWSHPVDPMAYLAEIQLLRARVRDWARSAGEHARLPSWAADIPALLPLMEQAVHAAEAGLADASISGSAAAGRPAAISQSSSPAPGSLIRADGNLNNVLSTLDGRLVFIDWEYSGWGDAAFDLAGLRWHVRSLRVPQPAWEGALSCYRPAPADVGFAERLAAYSRLLPAWWVVRSMLHLLEGAGQVAGPQRLVRMPARLYRNVRTHLGAYLAALGLMEAEDGEDVEV